MAWLSSFFVPVERGATRLKGDGGKDEVIFEKCLHLLIEMSSCFWW